MGLEHYNRKGELISLDEWCQMFGHNDVRRVALTELTNGKRVSTVWLGLDHRFGTDGPPLIFETMVFQGEQLDELDMDRYSTEAEALAGHERMVGKWSLIAGDSDEEDS